MCLTEQLHGDHRDAVLVSDATAGTVVGHCEGFAQRDRPTAPAPQDQPRPQRVTPPWDHADHYPDHQTGCGTEVSADDPSHQAGGRTPTMIVSFVGAVIVPAAPGRSATHRDCGHHDPGEYQRHIAGTVVRRRWRWGRQITRLWAPGASRSPAGTLKVNAATGSTTP